MIRQFCRRVFRNTSGAVLAEFAIVITPLLATFFSLLQIAFLYAGQLMLKHSAYAAARAAAVVLDVNGVGDNCHATKAKDGVLDYPALEVEMAAREALFSYAPALSNVRVSTYYSHLPAGATCPSDGAGNEVVAEVSASFACSVPLGNTLVCGTDHSANLTASVAAPRQCANYKC